MQCHQHEKAEAWLLQKWWRKGRKDVLKIPLSTLTNQNPSGPSTSMAYDLPSFTVHLSTYLISAWSTSIYKADALLVSGIRDLEDCKTKGFIPSPVNRLHCLGTKFLQASCVMALAIFQNTSWKATRHNNRLKTLRSSAARKLLLS